MRPKRQMGEWREFLRAVNQVGYLRATVGRGNRGQRADRSLNPAGICRGEHPAAVEPAHAVRDDVRLLPRIEVPLCQCCIHLIAQLAAAKRNSSRRIQDRNQHLQALRSKVLCDTAKIFDPEFLAKSQDSMDQNYVHDYEILPAQTNSNSPVTLAA